MTLAPAVRASNTRNVAENKGLSALGEDNIDIYELIV